MLHLAHPPFLYDYPLWSDIYRPHSSSLFHSDFAFYCIVPFTQPPLYLAPTTYITLSRLLHCPFHSATANLAHFALVLLSPFIISFAQTLLTLLGLNNRIDLGSKVGIHLCLLRDLIVLLDGHALPFNG